MLSNFRSSYSPHRQQISRSPSPLPPKGNYGNYPEPQPNKFSTVFDRLDEKDRVCNDIQAPQIIWFPQIIRPSTGPNIAQKEAREAIKDKEIVDFNECSTEKVFPNPVPNIPTLSMVQQPNTTNFDTVKNENNALKTGKGKRKKIQCSHCSDMFNNDTIKIHSQKCRIYDKLIQNGLDCSMCTKRCDSRNSLKQHIFCCHKDIFDLNLSLSSTQISSTKLNSMQISCRKIISSRKMSSAQISSTQTSSMIASSGQNSLPNIPSHLMVQPNTANSATQNETKQLSSMQISSMKIISSRKMSSTQISLTQTSSTITNSTQNSLPNIPSLLMVQTNTANSATQNEIPALQMEIEKERKKQIQCQHCSELFDTEYIEKHAQTCHLYEKIIQNGLECSICTKSFKRRFDVKNHIFDNHREMVQPNTANSTTLNKSPAVETDIEKERKKKVQCQHCSELFNTKYIKNHAQKCHLYEKFVRNGLQCSICSKSFEARSDVKQHIGHHHNNLIMKEIGFLNQSSPENVFPNIPTLSMTQPTSANAATQNESPALKTEIGKTVSQNIPNPVPNIASLLMVQPNTAKSATQNEIPALQTEIEKDRMKKIQCQHCSELFDTEYIKKHAQTCHLYEKIIQNGLECSICIKSFKRRCDVKNHIFDNHREMVQSNTANSTTLNKSPALEIEIGKEAKKKVQCQHCSEIINKKYITGHARKCQLYAKFVRNGLQCKICSKRFERRRDVNQHIGHHHQEVQFTLDISYFQVYSGYMWGG